MIVVMTVANLRGLRESGPLFAPPTYLYIVMLLLLIGRRAATGSSSRTSARSRSTTLSEDAQELADGHGGARAS